LVAVLRRHWRRLYDEATTTKSCTLILLCCLLVLQSTASIRADALPPSPISPLGDLTTLNGWSGLQAGKAGATLSTPAKATFRYPDGPRGRYNVGFASENDSTRDWSGWYGVRFDVNLSDDRPLTLQIAISGPDAATDHPTTTQTTLRGAGWHTVLLPWSSFDFPQEFAGFLHDVKQLTISAKFDDGTNGVVGIRNVCVVHGRSVWLDAIQRGRSVEAGGSANYTVTVGNCSDQPQVILLSFQRQGFEAMTSTVSPATVKLDSNAVAQVQVSVAVPDRVPPGGSETQTLIAVGGDAQLELLTAAKLSHPYIMLTSEGWDQVRAKVKKYDWAKSAADDYIAQADRWNGWWVLSTFRKATCCPPVFRINLLSTKSMLKKLGLFCSGCQILKTDIPGHIRRAIRRRCRKASSFSTSPWHTT
jgi:hypothetical protein